VLGLAELVELAGGELHGSAEVQVTAVAELGRAGAGDLVFVVDQKRLAALAGCDAAVALVPAELAAEAHAEYGLTMIGGRSGRSGGSDRRRRTGGSSN